MTINPNFESSKSFFVGFTKTETDLKADYSLLSRVCCLFLRLYHYITKTCDESLWESLKEKIRVYKADSEDKLQLGSFSVDQNLFYLLAEKRFTTLFKACALAYFEKQIQEGTESFESIKEKFKSKENTLQKLVDKISCKELLEGIGREPFLAFIKPTQKGEELSNLFETISHFLYCKAVSAQNKCQRKFLELFSSKELTSPDAWKFLFAKRISRINTAKIPPFAQAKLQALRENLPSDFDKKVSLWEISQKSILADLEKQVQRVQNQVLQGCNFAIRDVPEEQTVASFIADSTQSSEDYKFSVALLPASLKETESDDKSVLLYLTASIELSILEQCFEKYEGKVTEEAFLDAYNKWDKFAKDPVQLEKLLDKKVQEVVSLVRLVTGINLQGCI